METTYSRVLKRLAQIKKKPVRAKIKSVKRNKVKRVAPYRSTDKYSSMLQKLGQHFGHEAIPELLEFITNRKAIEENLKATPSKPTGKYRLVKQNKK